MERIEQLPNSGIYALHLFLEEIKLRVGALGEISFPRGYYVYIGTAQRNLRKRIERHFKKEKRKRWHIDYITPYAEILDVVAVPLSREWEEKTARYLEKRYPYIRNFGSSDTSALSHLFYSSSPTIWDDVKDFLNLHLK